MLWCVVENNFNEKTTTLLVVKDCCYKGIKKKVETKRLMNVVPIGPIFPPDGEIVPKDEIVIENGIEFIRPAETKKYSKVLKQKNKK